MPDNYWANASRQFGQGLTFGFSDELEAAIRAASGGDLARYQAIKANLEQQRKQWEAANPKAAIAAETGGMLVPGLVGAFVPGGQGATLGALARTARILDAPAERLLARAAPRALSALQSKPLGRLAVGLADEVGNGAVYSVGQAPRMRDIPQQVTDDARDNILGSLAVRGASSGAGALARKMRKRK